MRDVERVQRPLDLEEQRRRILLRDPRPGLGEGVGLHWLEPVLLDQPLRDVARRLEAGVLRVVVQEVAARVPERLRPLEGRAQLVAPGDEIRGADDLLVDLLDPGRRLILGDSPPRLSFAGRAASTAARTGI